MFDGKNPCDLCSLDCLEVDCSLHDFAGGYCNNSDSKIFYKK